MSIDLLECFRAASRLQGMSVLDVGVQEGVFTKITDEETGLILYFEGADVSVDFRSSLISSVLSGDKNFNVRQLHRRMLKSESYCSRFIEAKRQAIRDRKTTRLKTGK